MHEWVVFAHILGAMLFMLTHGASAAVVFRLRRERDPDAIRALLRLSHATTPAAYVMLLLLVGAGLLAAMTGRWLSAGGWWLWVSIALLVAITVAMYAFLARPFYELRARLGDDTAPVNPDELERALRAPGPMVGTGIGLVGTIVILWLMVLKPF